MSQDCFEICSTSSSAEFCDKPLLFACTAKNHWIEDRQARNEVWSSKCNVKSNMYISAEMSFTARNCTLIYAVPFINKLDQIASNFLCILITALTDVLPHAGNNSNIVDLSNRWNRKMEICLPVLEHVKPCDRNLFFNLSKITILCISIFLFGLGPGLPSDFPGLPLPFLPHLY